MSCTCLPSLTLKPHISIDSLSPDRYWGRIGKEVADETARVTILTLEDKQLQDKAFQLANVIVRTARALFFIAN